jgi:LCP family protein required for cell wall assembly
MNYNDDRSRNIYSGRKNEPESRNLYSHGHLPPKKRDNKRIIINVITSVVLFISIISLCAMTIIPNMTIGDPDMFKETASGLEDLVVSTDANVSYILVVGLDFHQELTDVIMLVCFDHLNNKANVLQIPRDTFAGTDVGKINAVYGSAKEGESGINCLRRRIYNLFGLPVDHFVTITLEGFRDVIDSVGGVEMYFEEKMVAEASTNPDDKEFGSEYYEIGPGWVNLTGAQAEAFVRHRRSYAKGDIGRVEAQRTFYAQFMKKVLGMTASQAFSIAKNCYNDITTDMKIGQILGYVEAAKKLNLEDIHIVTVPGQGQCYYRGQDCYGVHIDEYVELANQYFLPYSEKITASQLKLVKIYDKYASSMTDKGANLGELQQSSDSSSSQ